MKTVPYAFMDVYEKLEWKIDLLSSIYQFASLWYAAFMKLREDCIAFTHFSHILNLHMSGNRDIMNNLDSFKAFKKASVYIEKSALI